jgi:hypothetical protein
VLPSAHKIAVGTTLHLCARMSIRPTAVLALTVHVGESTMVTRTYLSAADAARVLGVTPATVRLMHRRGELPVAAKTEGGVHLFCRSDVDRVAAQRAQRQPSAGASQ